MPTTIWQQAAGDTDRDYADICVKWSVILNGPGGHGPWPQCEGQIAEVQQRKAADLRRFAKEMAAGDLVVLRRGTSKVVAVGSIVGEYEWNDGFGDIDGWDIQHVRRVRWHWHDLANPKDFGAYALHLGDTTQRLAPGKVAQWVSELPFPETQALHAGLPALPPEPNEVALSGISTYLFDHGVASTAITQLVGVVNELLRIGAWYGRSQVPSEHETVAMLVVPLLRTLGWTPQKMGIEWKHVDVALFQKLPRDDQNLRVVVEAKRMNLSCLSAQSQAQRYADGHTSCHRLIVTDGLRYGVYRRTQEGSFKLHAYLNLARLRDEYPILECAGAKEALLSMAPEWSSEPE